MREITITQAILATQFLMTDWDKVAGVKDAVATGRQRYTDLIRFYGGTLDKAVPMVLGAPSFDALLKGAKIQVTVVPDTWDGWEALWKTLQGSGRNAIGGWSVVVHGQAVARSMLVADPSEAWVNALAIDLMEDAHAAILAFATAERRS